MIVPNFFFIFAENFREARIMSEEKRYKIVYCTPALYMAGGVERVLTLKANYFAEYYDYDVTIVLTDGKDRSFFYSLSDKIKVVNLDINFEELWTCSFIKKVFVYLWKQYRYKKLLTKLLIDIKPDITISLLRREINFITSIPDGSKKIGELHINRANYRNFTGNNPLKHLFAWFWMRNLVSKLKRLNCLVVLTEQDKAAWTELDNVVMIPNPLSFVPDSQSNLTIKRVIAVGRYCHEKGYDDLLKAWSIVQNRCQNWRLDIYGDGERSQYEQTIDAMQIDRQRCQLHGRTQDIEKEYISSSLSVCSSRFEGFGLTIIEAMACGLPVVSFDCPWGPRSIIRDGEDGILVENANVEKLADSMLLLMTNDEKRHQMGHKAAINVQRFNIGQTAYKWKCIFEGL